MVGIRESILKLLNSWGFEQMLGVEVYSSEFCSTLTFVNIYGPFHGRIPF